MKFKTQSRKKTNKALEDEALLFQKNRHKIQTYINPFEENNDHTRITHKIQFRSSFKEPYPWIRVQTATQEAVECCLWLYAAAAHWVNCILKIMFVLYIYIYIYIYIHI